MLEKLEYWRNQFPAWGSAAALVISCLLALLTNIASKLEIQAVHKKANPCMAYLQRSESNIAGMMLTACTKGGRENKLMLCVNFQL